MQYLVRWFKKMAINVSVTFPYPDTYPLFVEYIDNAPQEGTHLYFDNGVGRNIMDHCWAFKTDTPRTIPIKRVVSSTSAVIETGSVDIVFPTLKGVERVIGGAVDETDMAVLLGVTPMPLTGWTVYRSNPSSHYNAPRADIFGNFMEGCIGLYCPGESVYQNVDLTDVPKIIFELGGQCGPANGGIARSDISFLIDGVVKLTVNTTTLDRFKKGHMFEVPIQYTGVHKVEFAITEGSPTDATKIGARHVRHISARTAHDPTVVDFSATPVNGLTVEFKDLSTEDPTAWKWDFGEGETAEREPIHTYKNPGTYVVKLTATNAISSGEKTKSIPVTVVVPPKPGTAFTSTVPNAATPLIIAFTDQSTETPTSWLWDFGDGGTSIEQNPSHQYVDYGSYPVKLMATNGNGSSTLTKTVTIIPPPPSGAALPSTVQVNTTTRITLTGTGFKSGSKVRITKPLLNGIVSKIISFSSTQIVFDFFFDPLFLGSCGISVISTSGGVKKFDNSLFVY
jgi:PKD repeat protein